MYSAYVQIESILQAKRNRLLRMLSAGLANTSNSPPVQLQDLKLHDLRVIVENVELSPTPLEELCPVCFADGSENAFICFDGNFQLTTLGTRVEARNPAVANDHQDKRLFVDSDLPTLVPGVYTLSVLSNLLGQ
jgi:hypothetical protein